MLPDELEPSITTVPPEELELEEPAPVMLGNPEPPEPEEVWPPVPDAFELEPPVPATPDVIIHVAPGSSKSEASRGPSSTSGAPWGRGRAGGARTSSRTRSVPASEPSAQSGCPSESTRRARGYHAARRPAHRPRWSRRRHPVIAVARRESLRPRLPWRRACASR